MTTVRTTSALEQSELTASQQARRDRIIDAALELSRQRSFEQTQVKDVAEAASVALGTVYHYFSSKDHLFAEALVRWAESLRGNVDRHPLRGDGPAERLAEVLHRSVRAFQQQPNFARLITTLDVSTDAFAIEIMSRLERETSGVYLAALEGVEAETARKIVRVVDLALAGLLRSWSAGRTPIVDVHDILDQTIALLFRN
jgi:TetR/AcrR family transcriptional regulator, cholesterol catabolism regulator